MSYEDSIAEKLASVLQCEAQDVGICASLSAGLHSLMATFYKPCNGNHEKIIMLESEFNSDVIVSESWLDIKNLQRENLILC